MVTDNNGDEYTIEAAAKHLIDERRGVEATFNSATQEQKEDIRQEMVYLINEACDVTLINDFHKCNI